MAAGIVKAKDWLDGVNGKKPWMHWSGTRVHEMPGKRPFLKEEWITKNWA